VKERTSFCEQKEAKKLYPFWLRAVSAPLRKRSESFLVTFFQKSNFLLFLALLPS